jgi:hypothetical protein
MNARRRTRPLFALAALLLVVAIAGCGGGSSSSSGSGIAGKPPAAILAATKVAADGAKSVHVSGSIVSGNSPITLDMQLLAGKGGRGQLSQDGLSFELIEHIGGSAAAQLLQGKWLKASATSSDFASLGQLTNLHELLDQTLSDHGALSKGGTKTIKGQQVVGITGKAKDGTLYVAATGKPYPIQIAKSGSSSDSITFDHWDEPLTLSAPANAIDINALQSAAK